MLRRKLWSGVAVAAALVAACSGVSQAAPRPAGASVVNVDGPAVAQLGLVAATNKERVYNRHAPWYESMERDSLPARVAPRALDEHKDGYWLVEAGRSANSNHTSRPVITGTTSRAPGRAKRVRKAQPGFGVGEASPGRPVGSSFASSAVRDSLGPLAIAMLCAAVLVAGFAIRRSRRRRSV
jgi:hypothetical protein